MHQLTDTDKEPLLKTGMLFVIESGMEGAKSEADILKFRIAKFSAMIAHAAIDA
jgi:hypothetical protein